MQFETINEPVEVITYFDGRKVRPMRFRWRNRPYHITRINGTWSELQGRDRVLHFHVSTKESGSFELIYQNSSLTWRLGRVGIES